MPQSLTIHDHTRNTTGQLGGLIAAGCTVIVASLLAISPLALNMCSASIWMRRRVNQDETRRPSGMMIDAGHASGKRFD